MSEPIALPRYSTSVSTGSPPLRDEVAGGGPGASRTDFGKLRQPAQSTWRSEPADEPPSVGSARVESAIAEPSTHLETRTVPLWNHGRTRRVSKSMEAEVAERESPFRRWPHEELNYLLRLIRSGTFQTSVVASAVTHWLQNDRALAEAAQQWTFAIAGVRGEKAFDAKARDLASKIRAASTLVLLASDQPITPTPTPTQGASAAPESPQRYRQPSLFDNSWFGLPD